MPFVTVCIWIEAYVCRGLGKIGVGVTFFVYLLKIVNQLIKASKQKLDARH